MKKTYILNTKDYLLEPYHSDSIAGDTLLAMPKNGDSEKLLVKYEDPSIACNEFICSRLSEILHIPNPTAYLIRISKQDLRFFQKGPFSDTIYAVGIELIGGLHDFDPKRLDDAGLQRLEYAEQFALSVLFRQADILKLEMTPSGCVIETDFSSCFNMDKYVLAGFGMSQSDRETLFANALTMFREHSFSMCAKEQAKKLAFSLGIRDVRNVYPAYHDAMKRFLALSDKHLRPLMDALNEFYPTEVSNHYKACFEILRERIPAYIEDAEVYRPLNEVKAAVSEDYWKQYEAFVENVRLEFGNRGVGEARKLIRETLEQYRPPQIPLTDLEGVLLAIQQAFLIAKREAREKFAPRKYKAQSEPLE